MITPIIIQILKLFLILGILAFNQDGDELGWLDWRRVGAHMHWVWFQEQDVYMSSGCLQEVRDKQKELFAIKRKCIK